MWSKPRECIAKKSTISIVGAGAFCCTLSKYMITGKIYNARSTLMRYTRDHPMRIDLPKFEEVIANLKSSLRGVQTVNSTEELRGVEGNAAHLYFSIFDDMILTDKKHFFFKREK